jgi:hypothetical protein
VCTWYLVRSVLQQPVNSIMPTRNGTAALTAMMVAFGASSERRCDGWRCLVGAMLVDKEESALNKS